MKQYQLGIYEKAMPMDLSWKEKLQVAKNAGFDWVEIAIDHQPELLERLDYGDEQIEEMLQASKEIGVKFLTLNFSAVKVYPVGSSNPEVVQQGLDIIKKALEFANKLSIRIIQMPGYGTVDEPNTEETMKRYVDNMKIVAGLAASYGIMIGFETIPNILLSTIAQTMEVVNGVNSPFIQAYPDFANLRYYVDDKDIDPFEQLKLAKGHTIAAHLKECDAPHNRRIPFGTGNDHSSYIQQISILKENGCRIFMAECWYKEGDYKQQLAFNYQFLTERLDKVFTD